MSIFFLDRNSFLTPAMSWRSHELDTDCSLLCVGPRPYTRSEPVWKATPTGVIARCDPNPDSERRVFSSAPPFMGENRNGAAVTSIWGSQSSR